MGLYRKLKSIKFNNQNTKSVYPRIDALFISSFLPLTLGKKGGDVSEAERSGGSACGGFKSAR